MTSRSPDEQIERLAPLFHGVRRSLYLYVIRAGRDVGRDEAAAAVDVGRSLAAFHLDKLVQGGFLEADYRRLSGRSGPGAGRPAKVYRPSDRQVEVAVPPRDYELAARILLEGVLEENGDDRKRAMAARRVGRALGREASARAGRRRGPMAMSRALLAVLEERGFHPGVGDDGVIRLRNCPFDALTADYRDTVCGLNLALLEGVAEGVGASSLRAMRDDSTPGCCVAFPPAGRESGQA